MKGGSYHRWWGNQEYVVNWANNGEELRAPGARSFLRNPSYSFRPGVTWSHTSTKGLSTRLLPPGFTCNVEGMAAYQKGPLGSDFETMALLNSSFAGYIINLLNPTIHFGGREVENLPYSISQGTETEKIKALVQSTVALARASSAEDETTYEFVSPPAWPNGAEALSERARKLAEVERQIDEEVYRLYDISAEDRQAIEAELAEPTLAVDDAGTATKYIQATFCACEPITERIRCGA